MYFLAKENLIVSNEFTKSLEILQNTHHGLTFFDFQEVIDFLEKFIIKLKYIRERHREELKPVFPEIKYVPTKISETKWIDVVIFIGDTPVCKIIKAKKNL